MVFTMPDFNMKWRVPMIEYASGSGGRLVEVRSFETEDQATRFYSQYNEQHPPREHSHLRAGEPYYD